MAVTQDDRFVLELDGRIWDKQRGVHYTSLSEIFPYLDELNNYVVDFENEIKKLDTDLGTLLSEVD